MFERFYHQVSNPYLWLLIVVVAIRGVYSCTRKKDYVHAVCFVFVLLVSGYFAAQNLGLVSSDFLDKLFGLQ